VFTILASIRVATQSTYPKAPTQLNERNMRGARLGMTYVLGKGDLLMEMQKKKNICPLSNILDFHL
jgi:hypothetical protein